MLLGLCSAGGAALCYGIGSVLQADAARRTTASTGLDPRLLTRLLRSGRYLIGVAADGAGFLLSLLAVTAVLAACKINVHEISARDLNDGFGVINAMVDVAGVHQLDNLIGRLRSIKGVVDVTRTVDTN